MIIYAIPLLTIVIITLYTKNHVSHMLPPPNAGGDGIVVIKFIIVT